MNDLEEYQQKRNLQNSSEPKPKIQRTSDKLIFVVQKHAASHLHYDLRLELNGVLKSWALPKGPPLKPGDKHLAIMVEDHPYDYKDFEGVIPEGNYGAGTVMIWDHGFYSLLKGGGQSEIESGLSKGHLSLILSGSKLKGEFALVKFIASSEKNTWLMIKPQKNRR